MSSDDRWVLSGRVYCPRTEKALHLSDQRFVGYPNRNPHALDRMVRHVRQAIERSEGLQAVLQGRAIIVELELRRPSRTPGVMCEVVVREEVVPDQAGRVADEVAAAVRDVMERALP